MVLFTIITLLLISARANCFVAGRHRVLPRPGSAIYYADIESEISSVTSNRPAVHVNRTNTNPCHAGEHKISDQPFKSAGRMYNGATKTVELKRKASPKKDHEVTWQKLYVELSLYKERHGDCLVPQKYAPNPKLGLWVMYQRRQYALQKNGKRSAFDSPRGKKHIEQLEELGFVWRVRRRGPRVAYDALRRLQQRADNIPTNVGCTNDPLYMADFEKYMIQKSEVYSEEEMKQAWRRRFELFR